MLYHLVFPAKYRKEIFSDKVTESLKDICLGISHCYEIHFVEIGSDDDHVHFLVQSVSSLSVSRVATIVKSITVCEVFSRHKEVKKVLWSGNLWTSGFYANTVGEYANAESIQKYISGQGTYKRLLFQQLTSVCEKIPRPLGRGTSFSIIYNKIT